MLELRTVLPESESKSIVGGSEIALAVTEGKEERKGTRLRAACLGLCPYWLVYATAATLVAALEGDEAS